MTGTHDPDATVAAPVSEFLHGIGNPARRALALQGYLTHADLTKVTAKELLALHGVGPKAVGILEQELTARGLSFRTP